jgi:carbonic anhydrase/acetyltransferase-like protein (isoleucine patch superfamily)
MADGYRSLSAEEVKSLEAAGCRSNSWQSVLVREPFDTSRLRNVTFSGTVKMGLFTGFNHEKCGLPLQHGIYNAHIHNCSIGDNVTIADITGYIANYDIGDGTVIKNCGHIAVEGKTSFGNGTRVAVLNESGGRAVPIWDRLTSHMAYIITLYRHKPEAIRIIESLIQEYAESVSSERGEIGPDTTLEGCRTIKNVRIGENTVIEDVTRLCEGTINSTFNDPVFIGSDVIMDHFIICSGSKVTDGAVIDKCFIGQGCILAKQYSAENSLFFANCGGYHGEACSVFGGPFTVTHHKSTLLIAGIFSFMNAGSGSNQSNHMYKLGPIHQGIMERGSKTTSDSYVLWPSRIGPFTLVMGRHYSNVDTTMFPFSYLLEKDDETVLIPAINLRSVGTMRDAQKWPVRDVRNKENRLDQVNYNLLSPFTVGKMMLGRGILASLAENGEKTSEYIPFDGMKIKISSIDRGIKLYQMGIDKFLGNSLIKHLEGFTPDSEEELRNHLIPKSESGAGEWVDMAGLIAPLSTIDDLISSLEKGKIKSTDKLNDCFAKIHSDYHDLEWVWSYSHLGEELGKAVKEVTGADVINVVERWKKSVVELDEMLLEDAHKEFTLSSMTGFGIDGDDEIKRLDFEQVRGEFDKNPVVLAIREHIKQKSALGDELINRIKRSGLR